MVVAEVPCWDLGSLLREQLLEKGWWWHYCGCDLDNNGESEFR